MEPRSPEERCPLCGPTRLRRFTREGPWTVARCGGCGLLLTWPPPAPEILASLYGQESYYDDRAMGGHAAEAALDRARAILDDVQAPVRRVLDLGAGEGHLVAAFQRLGVVAHGFEPSPAGRAAARQRHGLELMDRIEPGRGPYDLATAVHVVEHVPDPVAFSALAREVLAHGGCFFVEVPHVESVEMWRPARRRQILDLPAHLCHFTPYTLREVLRRAGFEVRWVRTVNPDALEWALALRARLKRGAPGRPALDAAGDRARTPAPAPCAAPARAWWRSGLLPWIREHFPGWKLLALGRR